MRLVTLFKQAGTELRYLVHPRGISSVRVSGQTIRKNVIYGVYAFFPVPLSNFRYHARRGRRGLRPDHLHV